MTRLAPNLKLSLFSAAVALLLMLTIGCASGVLKGPIHKMGELTTVGPVIYNVLETNWADELGGAMGRELPKHRFLLIRLTVTNSGNRDVAVPLLSLEDEQGHSYRELSKVEGVPNWLGLLRVLQPASHLQGVIVFDVPPMDYRLRVTDCGDLENEKTALIEIPLTFGGPQPVEPPGGSPDSF